MRSITHTWRLRAVAILATVGLVGGLMLWGPFSGGRVAGPSAPGNRGCLTGRHRFGERRRFGWRCRFDREPNR